MKHSQLPIHGVDGHDFPRLIDQGVPGLAAKVDDVVEKFEDPAYLSGILYPARQTAKFFA